MQHGVRLTAAAPDGPGLTALTTTCGSFCVTLRTGDFAANGVPVPAVSVDMTWYARRDCPESRDAPRLVSWLAAVAEAAAVDGVSGSCKGTANRGLDTWMAIPV